MQKYCHHCGKQVMPGSKFCSACGGNLSSLSATPANNVPKVPGDYSPAMVGGNDEDDRVDRIAHLDIRLAGLQVEIVKPQAPLTETIGGVIAQGANSKPESVAIRQGPYANVDAKTFLDEWRKETGPTKRHEIE